MNERIENLMLKATKDMPQGYYVPGVYFQKFAELIVRECIYRVRSRQQFAGEDQQNVTQAFDLLVYDLESHFGVEE